MGSTIQVKSQLGQGSEFSFKLDFPLAEAQQQTALVMDDHTRGDRIVADPQNAHKNLMNSASQRITPLQTTTHPLVLPSKDVVESLLCQAISGRVLGIRQNLETLLKTDAQYSPFVESLLPLAEQFRVEDIEKQLRTYMQES